MNTSNDSLREERRIADRFATELATCRITVDNLRIELAATQKLARERDIEIDRLREGIRECAYLCGSEVLQAMLEDLLIGSAMREDMPA